MGSFNIRCFASNQVIAEGNACRIIPIVQSSTFQPAKVSYGDKTYQVSGAANNSCSVSSFWKQASSMLEGKYTDFGTFELSRSPLNRARAMDFFSNVLRYAPVVSQGESSHDLPFDFKKFVQSEAPAVWSFLAKDDNAEKTSSAATTDLTALADALAMEIQKCWTYITEVAYKHRLFSMQGSHRSGAPAPMGFAVLHEAMYQAMVAKISAPTSRDDQSFEPRVYLKTALEEGLKSMADRDASFQRFALHDHLKDALGRVTLESYLAGPIERRAMWMVTDAIFERGQIEDADIECLVPILLDRYAVSGLESFNLCFIPLTTAGQDNDNSAGREYAELVSGVSRTVTRQKKVQMYGEYLPYMAIVPNESEFKALIQTVHDSDGDIDDVVHQALPDGQVQVHFSATFDLETLTEVIESHESPHAEAIGRSLVAMSEQEDKTALREAMPAF